MRPWPCAALLLLFATGDAGGKEPDTFVVPTLPEAPSPPPPLEGECPRAWSLRPGRPVPAALVEVVDGQVIARCAAEAIPTSKAAHALETASVRYPELRQLHAEHTARWQAERAYWRTRTFRAEEPIAWHLQPSVQQVVGGMKMLLAVGFGVAIVRVSSETGRAP